MTAPSPQAEEELQTVGAPGAELSDGLVSSPWKTGISGDQILEALGAKAKDLGTGGFLAKEQRRSHGARARPQASSQGQLVPLPGGSSLVFREDGLAMRLNFMLVCIFL